MNFAIPRTSGHGFVEHENRRYWGRFGAAGLFLRHRSHSGGTSYFLAQRSAHVHSGNGQWALPGGAIDVPETALGAALREFEEEIGELPPLGRVVGEYVHIPAPGLWSYTTIVIEALEAPSYENLTNPENDDARWVHHDELWELDLFPPLRNALPDILQLFSHE